MTSEAVLQALLHQCAKAKPGKPAPGVFMEVALSDAAAYLACSLTQLGADAAPGLRWWRTRWLPRLRLQRRARCSCGVKARLCSVAVLSCRCWHTRAHHDV